jgi:hypothetical protein
MSTTRCFFGAPPWTFDHPLGTSSRRIFAARILSRRQRRDHIGKQLGAAAEVFVVDDPSRSARGWV